MFYLYNSVSWISCLISLSSSWGISLNLFFCIQDLVEEKARKDVFLLRLCARLRCSFFHNFLTRDQMALQELSVPLRGSRHIIFICEALYYRLCWDEHIEAQLCVPKAVRLCRVRTKSRKLENIWKCKNFPEIWKAEEIPAKSLDYLGLTSSLKIYPLIPPEIILQRFRCSKFQRVD